MVVVAQFFVPAVLLLDPQQSPLGWQMYAGRVSMTSMELVDSSGGTVVPPDRWFARLRPEVDWAEHAPAHACAAEQRVAAVRIAYSDGEVTELTCPGS